MERGCRSAAVLQPDLPVDILHGRTHPRSLVIAFYSLDSLSVVPLLVTLSLSPLVSLPHFPSRYPHRSGFGLTSPVVPPTVEGHRRICSTLGVKGGDRVSRLSIKPTTGFEPTLCATHQQRLSRHADLAQSSITIPLSFSSSCTCLTRSPSTKVSRILSSIPPTRFPSVSTHRF